MISLLFVMALEPSVLINEVAWMGDNNNWRNEWIELYNQGLSPISLDRWTLVIDDTKTTLSGIIDPNSFFIISKDKNTRYDNILKGSLKNTGNHLTLLDSSNSIVDEQDFSSGWPAGDNQTKRTMERTSNGWQTSLNIVGTPGKENSLLVSNLKLSDIEILEDSSNISNFSRIFFQGIILSSFISIIGLYLNLRLKKYSIKD